MAVFFLLKFFAARFFALSFGRAIPRFRGISPNAARRLFANIDVAFLPLSLNAAIFFIGFVSVPVIFAAWRKTSTHIPAVPASVSVKSS